ncbi:MAG: hypothetical protein PHD70_10450 [Anaerostipes sp.]|nr:hypothetical protein [Anaerostipes sp.]
MLLSPDDSLCEKNQAIIVSKDRGAQREHRAINPQKQFDLRHYKLDGVLIQQTTCCDYLLVNDSSKKAYLIELKGGNIDDAVKQLEAGEQKCKAELKGYIFFYRIVCSKARTHKLQGNKYRKFKEKCGEQLKTKVNLLEENLV